MTNPMNAQSLSELTLKEFTDFLDRFYKADFSTDEEMNRAIAKFRALAQHPSGSDLIYYPEPGKENPDAVVAEVERYRRENGLSGFKVQ